MAKLNKDDVIASLKEMTILELNELIEAIEEEFGVTAAAPVAVVAADDGAAAGEPTEVTVTITEVGASKVNVIKAVREITGLGLLEAKQKVEATPAVIKENIPVAEAEEIKTKLVDAGAAVEVK
ncbi:MULTISPECIES: 50S ribosomal protein L7/L12 [Breznakia]|uniref:Large ribosomal subunit protein bL12 n=1 Tax=Breznakia blatticola TaxID=1754012 RepID=A0A4R7ZI14_9FIRM|nr:MULTISPECIES: 50S ribosomal protein L7/L12 [Breznakia]OCN03469.1 50S ribosomal protein L7/L12 [Erysipelotrichaceae bacterium MTC7]MDH6366475.1 large subunit ribosomal protein L7/L12 [Breznakia sp. PH1-1]MDH6403568.1 large subunit ribosomal protein L7/L12 [Breznakia sp. PF1-11]MDH6411277.1 large subunit ribosomal protein L7/L12 [Breznakia sp. PFB1-11]MDH6413747.1 large subunit ribosomal protein L7/L12 [Breznakia sp. PFB1-14]